jgi:hypothetical protein
MAKTARAVQWQVDHFTEVPVLMGACLRLGVRKGRVPFVRMPMRWSRRTSVVSH